IRLRASRGSLNAFSSTPSFYRDEHGAAIRRLLAEGKQGTHRVQIASEEALLEAVMKILPLVGVVTCSLALLLPPKGKSQPATSSVLYITAGTSSARIRLAANSILREDPPDLHSSPWASIVRLKENVEIRTCCVELPLTMQASRTVSNP